jgi:hypothetical protein
MNSQHFEIAERDRERLRAIVATIERELAGLLREAPSAEHRESERVLRASWAQLVEILDLGSSPELRDCPVCDEVCMRTATLCGNCWTKLGPWKAPPAAMAKA